MRLEDKINRQLESMQTLVDLLKTSGRFMDSYELAAIICKAEVIVADSAAHLQDRRDPDEAKLDCKACGSDDVKFFEGEETITRSGIAKQVAIVSSECNNCGREFIAIPQIMANDRRILEAFYDR